MAIKIKRLGIALLIRATVCAIKNLLVGERR